MNTTKKQNLILCVCSFAINAILFLFNIAFYNCVFATNDDYRMSLIVSGAYTGEPSDTLVFMKYPIAWLLSSLYKITAGIPWYGIFTMLCIFIPSCLICFFILRETSKSKYPATGILLYLLFYLFIVQKHVILPQFTLTAAFMACAWLLLIWYMPNEKGTLYLIGSGIFAAIAFSIRMKVFLMIVPVAVLIVIIKLMKEVHRSKKYILKYVISAVITILLCGTSQFCDVVKTDSEYKDFNTARSLVYDFGALPPYDANKQYYDSVGIDETLFYDISARYLDLDGGITTEKLRSVDSYNKELANSTPAYERLINAFFASSTYFLQESIIYQTIFVFILLVIAVFAAYRKKKYFFMAIPLCTLAGMFLEMTYLCYISRVMDRLTEVFLLAIAIACIIALNAVLVSRTDANPSKTFERYSKIWIRVCKTVSIACILCVGVCLIISNQNAVTEKSKTQNLINSRLEVLNRFSANDKDSFYFYDAYDFIAASSDVFAVYDSMVNTDSLGNWYVNSPDYFKRNAKYGITNSIDGLTDGNKNIYYAAIGNLKNGITLTMKERYNMEPIIVKTIPYENNNIYIYTFIPCG